MKKYQKYLILILTLILIFIFNNIVFFKLNLDVDDYYLLGQNLINLKSFSRELIYDNVILSIPVLDRLPLYPIINAIGYAIFQNDDSLIYFNYLFFFLSSVFFLKILNNYFEVKTSLLIIILNYFSFVNLKNIVSVNPAILCNLLLIILTYLIFQKKYFIKKNIFFIFIIIASLLLTKHDTIFFIFPFLISLYYFTRKKIYVFFIIQSLIVILIWSSINFYRADYFGYSNLSIRAPYVNYVLFNKTSEQEKYEKFIQNKKKLYHQSLRDNVNDNFYKSLDQYYKTKIIDFLFEKPILFIKISVKSILAIFIHSSHPNENLIANKFSKNITYVSDKKSMLDQLSLENNLSTNFVYHLVRLFSILFGLVLLFFNFVFLKNIKKNLNFERIFIYSLNLACFIYISFSGILGGLSYGDRGLALVYNFLLLIMIYQVKNFKLKK